MKFLNLKQDQTYNTTIQLKKINTKTQSLASLTLKDNLKQLYKILQTLRLKKFFNQETTYELFDRRKEPLIVVI